MGKCKLFKKISVISSIILIVFISCGCRFNLNLNSNKATNKLYHAIELGNFEAVKEAVSEGCNINSFKPKRVRVWDMAKVDSPLVESLFNNRDDIAEYLIEQGADTNYVSPSGKSILTYLILFISKTLIASFENSGAKTICCEVNKRAISTFTSFVKATTPQIESIGLQSIAFLNASNIVAPKAAAVNVLFLTNTAPHTS